MSEDKPSASELGIRLSDQGLEVREPYSMVRLPDPPKNFHREETLPPQETFSSNIKNIVLVPVRAELHNGQLINFLTQLNKQQGLNQDKLGIVLFLNDNKIDAEEKPSIIEENRLTAQFLSMLTARDTDGIDRLNLPEDYKELAKSIIEKDQLEIRLDYAHRRSILRLRFGSLCLHLFNLANSFKNPATPDQEVILHLSDVDTNYSPNHFANLKHFYTDGSHLANISEEDFIPSTHENPQDENISRDLLSILDEFRFYRYYAETQMFLNGELRSGTPMISGRLAYFFDNGQLRPTFRQALHQGGANEDFRIGKVIRSDSLGESLGNVGEVYRMHRARTPLRPDAIHSDAEEAFHIVKEVKNTGGIDGYHFLNDGDTLLGMLEQLAANATHGTKRFKQSDEYKQALSAEIKKEEVKVRLRRTRLFDYIEFLSSNRELGETEEKILAPYIQYFGDETENMRLLLESGQTPEQVGVIYLQKYASFFNPNSPLHIQIARVRALKKYAFTHNLATQVNNIT